MIVHIQTADDSFDSRTPPFRDPADEISRRHYYRFSKSVGWQPAVNVYEDERRFYLCVELAGLAKDEIDVEAVGRKLLIRGERPVPAPPPAEGSGCILRMEIDSGRFERAIQLPDQADMDQVEARLNDGFLWITINKRTG